MKERTNNKPYKSVAIWEKGTLIDGNRSEDDHHFYDEAYAVCEMLFCQGNALGKPA